MAAAAKLIIDSLVKRIGGAVGLTLREKNRIKQQMRGSDAGWRNIENTA
jgi:hypothetical protein